MPLNNEINSIVPSICDELFEKANKHPPIITHSTSRIDCKIKPSVTPFMYSLVFLPQYPLETPNKTVKNKSI